MTEKPEITKPKPVTDFIWILILGIVIGLIAGYTLFS